MSDDEPGIREQLIEGGLALVRDEGLVDLSVRRLAAAGDRSTMCLYTKFGGRQGLLEAVYDAAATRLEQQLASAADVRRAYWVFATEEPRLYGLLLSAELAPLGIEDRRRAELLERVCAALADGEGEDRADGHRTWAELHGRAALAHLGLRDAEFPRELLA